jgi:hypothetical protein
VASRTEVVYNSIVASKPKTFHKKVRNLWECGRMAGPLMAVLFLFCHYWIIVLNFFNA